MFWVDIGTLYPALKLKGGYTVTSISVPDTMAYVGWNRTPDMFMPAAKLGVGNHIYVYETNGRNFYGISELVRTVVGNFGGSSQLNGIITSNPTISTVQAYSMDSKVDDGMPTSGRVQANYLTSGTITASPHTQNPAILTDCYDSSATPQYAKSGSAIVDTRETCGLSFEIQQ